MALFEPPYEIAIALRYMRSRRKAGISLTSFLTISGVAMGVAALTVVTSVWNGFEAEFLDKLLGVSAHAVVLRNRDVFRNHDDVARRLREIPGIAEATPFVYSEVLAQTEMGVQGIAVKGIAPDEARKTPLAKYVTPETFDRLRTATSTSVALEGSRARPTAPGILIGTDLANVLHAKAGDSVALISPYGGRGGEARTAEFRVVGIFHTGMFEFDSRMAFIDLEPAQNFFRLHRTVTGLEVWTHDPMSSFDVIRSATLALEPTDPFAFEVRDWSRTNSGLFGAVRSQKVVISIVLFINVLVASFGIMATLILLILEKRREIAVLRALGATDRSILAIFVVDGQIIGLAGCALGLVVGLTLCAVLHEYGMKLDPRVYYLEHLPIVVRPIELLVVTVGAMILATLATLFPARKAARMSPVDGLTEHAGARTRPRTAITPSSR